MPRTAAELDKEVEELKAKVARLELELHAAQQELQRVRSDFDRWGGRAWQLILGLVLALFTASLATISGIVLYLIGIKKP